MAAAAACGKVAADTRFTRRETGSASVRVPSLGGLGTFAYARSIVAQGTAAASSSPSSCRQAVVDTRATLAAYLNDVFGQTRHIYDHAAGSGAYSYYHTGGSGTTHRWH